MPLSVPLSVPKATAVARLVRVVLLVRVLLGLARGRSSLSLHRLRRRPGRGATSGQEQGWVRAGADRRGLAASRGWPGR
jgi:hypothetical protein